VNALFVAWRSGDSTHGAWGPVGRLEHGTQAGEYRFLYTRGALTIKGFRPFAGMDDLNSVYASEELFPLFANRLLAKSRPEYEAYLTWGGFDPNNPPDPIAVLGVTEGLRTTDSLELFPCPVPDESGCFINKFFLHGVRWSPPAALVRIAALNNDEPLGLMLDISNSHDRDAVAVRTCDGQDRFLIGYVPRYLARDVRKLVSRCDPDSIGLSVERVNPKAPLQQRVLCRLKARWPYGFRPYDGDEFKPIVDVPFPQWQPA
jgi:hypothetical protein